MKIDMLGFRVDEWEISNADPDQTCAISPRQLVALLKALENACEDRNRPTQSSPLSSWLEGFEAGCELSRNRQGVSLSSLPPLLQAAAAFSPAWGLTPSQPEMPVSSPSGRGESTASQALSDSDQGSSDSSPSLCVVADKVEDTGDDVMSSPGTTAIPDGITAARSQHAGTKKSQVSHLVDFLVFHGMATDAEDARCLIRKGSVSINGVAVSSEHCRLFPGDVITRDFAWHPPFCAPLVDGIPVKPRDPITVTVDADFDAVLAQRHGERLEIVTGQSGVSGFMNGIRPPTLADAQNTHAMVMRLFANARRLNAKIKALRGATTGAAGSKARQKGQPRG